MGDFHTRKGQCLEPAAVVDMFPFTVTHKWIHFLDFDVKVRGELFFLKKVRFHSKFDRNLYDHCTDQLPVMHKSHYQFKPNPQVLIHLRLGHTEWNEYQNQGEVLKVNFM